MTRWREKILTNPALLPAAAENNLREKELFWCGVEGGQVHRERDANWCLSTAPGGSNSVFNCSFSPREGEARLERIIRSYRDAGVGATFWIGPAAHERGVDKLLKARRVALFKHVPGMACDLRSMKKRFARPRGLKIEPCEDGSRFERYEHPYYGPMTTAIRRTDLDVTFRAAALLPRRVWNFVASVNGVPLGWTTLFLAEGVAGIYDVGVVKHARRQGIGTAVLIGALEHARKLGYRYSVLQASWQGEQVYRRLGYEEVTRVSTWYCSKALQRKQLAGAN